MIINDLIWYGMPLGLGSLAVLMGAFCIGPDYLPDWIDKLGYNRIDLWKKSIRISSIICLLYFSLFMVELMFKWCKL